MRKLELYLELDNDAFTNDEAWEAARILSNIADWMRGFSKLYERDYPLFDINGNKIGRLVVEQTKEIGSDESRE